MDTQMQQALSQNQSSRNSNQEDSERPVEQVASDGRCARFEPALADFIGATVELVGFGIELDGDEEALSRPHAVCRYCAVESPTLFARCAETLRHELRPGMSRLCGRGHHVVCHGDGLRVVLPKTLTATGGVSHPSAVHGSGPLARFLDSLRALVTAGGIRSIHTPAAEVGAGGGRVGGRSAGDGGGRAAAGSIAGGSFDPLLTSMVRSLVAAIDAKDPYTRGHSERVQIVASALGRTLDIDSAMASDLYWAALLHDIGKIGVPDQILRKRAVLTEEELSTMRLHPVLGADMLQPLAWLERACLGVRHHHERIDGTGYPDGLAGGQIPLIARVIAVADTFDAMISRRYYRPERGAAEALEEMIEVAGTQLDMNIVAAAEDAFERICAEVSGASHIAEGLIADDDEGWRQAA